MEPPAPAPRAHAETASRGESGCSASTWHIVFSKGSSAHSVPLPAVQDRAVQGLLCRWREGSGRAAFSRARGFIGEPRSPGPVWGCVCDVLPVHGNLERNVPSSARCLRQTSAVSLGVEPQGGERVLMPMRNEHLWSGDDRATCGRD